jgi:NADH-quinone oxidoreductase subunit E
MFEKKEAAVYFTDGLLNYIDQWKNKDGNLIMILHRVQEEYGYIPREAALQVSRLLSVPLAKIYGVVTFYHFFRLTKPGKNTISVCMGTACYLKGGENILNELESHLGIGVGGTTEDGMFSLQAVRCVGCCGLAPVISINDEIHGRLTKEMLPEILAKYRAREGVNHAKA